MKSRTDGIVENIKWDKKKKKEKKQPQHNG